MARAVLIGGNQHGTVLVSQPGENLQPPEGYEPHLWLDEGARLRDPRESMLSIYVFGQIPRDERSPMVRAFLDDPERPQLFD